MNGNPETGKKTALAIGIYILVKLVFNGIPGGFGLYDTVISVAMFGLLITGVAYCNYIVAAVLVFTALKHIGYNISHLPSSAIYLAEGVIDIAAAAVLVFDKNVKSFFLPQK